MADFLFQLFGSASSKDVDAIVFVDAIDENPFHGTESCKKYNSAIAEILQTDKKVNSNLAILEGGTIVKVLKGTSDETNNSLLRTYDLHPQLFPNQIRKTLARDLDLKVLRTTRVLLSLLSRTQYRTEVKLALQQDFSARIQTLAACNISVLDEFTIGTKGETKEAFEDFKKSYAFQIGQTLALMDGIELYTKEEISEVFTELSPFIQRARNTDMELLEEWKHEFIERSKGVKLKTLVEYKI